MQKKIENPSDEIEAIEHLESDIFMLEKDLSLIRDSLSILKKTMMKRQKKQENGLCPTLN